MWVVTLCYHSSLRVILVTMIGLISYHHSIWVVNGYIMLHRFINAPEVVIIQYASKFLFFLIGAIPTIFVEITLHGYLVLRLDAGV